MDKKQTSEFFYIEAKNDYNTNNIIPFFEKKSITVKKIELDKKGEKSSSYKVEYVYNPDTIIAIDCIKKEHLYDKESFRITRLHTNNNFQEIVDKKIIELKQSKKITYPIKYEDNINTNFIKQVGAIGLEFINQEIMEKQRSVLSYLLKSLGNNLFQGKSIMNISLPIYISDYRSQVEKNHHEFLEKAGDASNIERMKLVTTSFISGLHFGLTMGKPFNPIIGETFQCKSGNSLVYAEQTSHHPPITSFLIVNPMFKQYGSIGMEATAAPNTMTGKIVGKFNLEFNDGTVYNFKLPDFTLSGIMVGRRYINWNGAIKIDDTRNNLTSYLRINPDERSFFGKMFSKDTFPDYFNGFICNTDELVLDKKTGFYSADKKCHLAKLEGEWSRFVNINDVCYWRQDEQVLTDMERMDYTIPSDCHYRPDLILYKMGLVDQAQEAKVFLEEDQRKDKHLRDENKSKTTQKGK